ncbi:unnamed protein product [Effrenium voratum]|nr:unnamed protein product [Effrenium voratum]
MKLRLLPALLVPLVPAEGALSISSGYETFLTQIRTRIVCAEDDVYDEAALVKPCDSMKDGPFCRGLPESGTARHRPFTLDSIVPQHLFGDPRAALELEEGAVDADTQATKQAIQVLNRFLEKNSVKESMPSSAWEGRLDFRGLWGGSAPRGFSAGLPPEVYATWEGAWQVVPAVEGPGDWMSKAKRKPRVQAALRLNGAIGAVRFSRPVVVRSLQLRPEAEAEDDLVVLGRIGGMEVWRHAYRRKDLSVPLCGTGDLVLGRWEGGEQLGQYYYARILAPHTFGATVMWLDHDPTHRLVVWEHLLTPAGKPCADADGSDSLRPNRLWRDVARRTKAVDEVAFLSRLAESGSEPQVGGWLLGRLHLAAERWKAKSDSVNEAAVRPPAGTTSRVVQVLPGPHATMEEASSAAVFYNADDMLERGLRLKSWSRRTLVEPQAKVQQRLQLSAFRSVEGLKQVVRALMLDVGRPSLKLPAHISEARVLRDMDYLVTAMNVGHLQPEDQEKVVERYKHFEVFFSDLWDWRAGADSLHVLYELWMNAPKMHAEAVEVFQERPKLAGLLLLHPGPHGVPTGHHREDAERFREPGAGEGGSDLHHRQEQRQRHRDLRGDRRQLEPSGRVLILEPVPDSWKAQPKNFVMVGTQGIVSSSDDGTGRSVYAGMVPIYGCDSFELFSEAKSPERPPLWQNNPWNGALLRLSQAIDVNRQVWRRILKRLMAEKPAKAQKVKQIMELTPKGLVKVEVTSANEFVLKLKR